ncbi:tRNA methyltransferase [Aureococcus anophagefferens]|uniref:tRNA methyltransferase n=1 Tax=Aureococcus anophagefferens TaxID=44056 RepID=A0ABR1G6W9_AURAN
MAARDETKPLRVAAILIGSLGDVAPFADLFSRLPRVEPTIFCLDEAVAYVEKRGMAAVGLFSIETWKENETTLDGATLTGMDFVKAWIRHMLAPATLDDCVAKIREHHVARPFDALLYQTQAFPVVFFCAGDLRARGRRPRSRARRDGGVAGPVPTCAMPYLWHAYYETVFTLLLENGWREACERHGREIETPAQGYQRSLHTPRAAARRGTRRSFIAPRPRLVEEPAELAACGAAPGNAVPPSGVTRPVRRTKDS